MLTFKSRTPFMSLDPDTWQSPRSDYWHKHLRVLIHEVGLETVQHKVMLVQFYGYQSWEFARPPATLPSQCFSFALVREAVAAAKPMVIMRGNSLWPRLTRRPGHGSLVVMATRGGEARAGVSDRLVSQRRWLFPIPKLSQPRLLHRGSSRYLRPRLLERRERPSGRIMQSA